MKKKKLWATIGVFPLAIAVGTALAYFGLGIQRVNILHIIYFWLVFGITAGLIFILFRLPKKKKGKEVK